MIVILYVMDCLRPDFLSCYGYEKQTSPHIDKLARESAVFLNAFAQSTWTRPSCASLLTSTYPSVHQVWTIENSFSSFLPCLPELFKKEGFRTTAISAVGNFGRGFGFGRGFDNFIELYSQPSVMEKRRKLPVSGHPRERHIRVDTAFVPISTSEDINDFLFPLLNDGPNQDKFFLLWSIDTHEPWFRRDTNRTGSSADEELLWFKDISPENAEDLLPRIRLLYEDMISYNDDQLGRLMQRLKAAGLYDDTLLILTSDHGIAFGEHGKRGHAGLPYDEQIRVPLIIKFPKHRHIGTIDGLVQHIDLAPTLLDYIGAEIPSGTFQGRSLMPLLAGREATRDFVLAETQWSSCYPRHIALRTRDFKYMESYMVHFPSDGTVRGTIDRLFQKTVWTLGKPRMLFALRDDPAELTNTIREQKGAARSPLKRLKAVGNDCHERARRPEEWEMTPAAVNEQTARQLRALGYF
jgi:arylsulfatase A-like enzyme